MARVSSYLIGTYVGDGKAVFVHGYSGALDLVESVVFDILESSKDGNIEKKSLDDDLYQFLCERGYITEKTELEEREYVERMVKALNKKNRMTNASFTIVVTYDCNLCCPYCFEKEYAWKLKKHTLDKTTVDKIYLTIDDIQAKTKKVNRNITLFGGEPFLKKNIKIVEYIISEGRKRDMKFSAITNGVELDSFIHLIDRDIIGHIQITMDGVGETHDRTRCHREGVRTFDTIIKNIRLALEKGISVSVRFNADKENYSDFEKLEKYFSECGFTNFPKFNASMSRTINYTSEMNQNKFFSQKEFINFIDANSPSRKIQDFSAYKILSTAIKDKAPLNYKGSFCSSQINGYVFDPILKIYPCWEVIGDERNCIGDFSEGVFRENQTRLNLWPSDNFYQDCCKKCPSLLFCCGGCFAKNLHSFQCTQMTDIIKRNAIKVYNEYIKN